MRLWHQSMIKYLPRQQLLGQHRECCALRGLGWNKKHSTVNYVFKYSQFRLFMFHRLVMLEMLKRNYKVSKEWWIPNYRGAKIGFYNISYESPNILNQLIKIYPEHNNNYLKECLKNLKKKGVKIENSYKNKINNAKTNR
jgi:uncharacterized protein (TIGR02328 family)